MRQEKKCTASQIAGGGETPQMMARSRSLKIAGAPFLFADINLIAPESDRCRYTQLVRVFLLQRCDTALDEPALGLLRGEPER